MSVIFVYITAPDRDDALRIGRTLVEERLAACVNVFDGMTSVYRWQGAVEQAQEAVLIAKTTQERFEPLARRVRELHSYECPCVVSWEIGSGSPPYLEWIERESRA
jgi:periplasmic divalent cation tolerance protein